MKNKRNSSITKVLAAQTISSIYDTIIGMLKKKMTLLIPFLIIVITQGRKIWYP